MSEIFISSYGVTIGDINYGGHMGNDKALIIFQEARMNFLKSLGYSEMDIGNNLGIILVETNVRYLREVFHGEILDIAISVSEIKGKKFTLSYEVERKPAGERVFTGFTSFLSFDYSNRKVAPLPERFKEQLNTYKHL